MKKMKIVCLLLVIALLTAVPIIASATEEEIIASGVYSGGLKWEVSENGTLTLSGYVDFAGSGGMTYPWEAYSDVITRVVVAEGIDRIQWNFFDDLHNITQVQLPTTVTEIPASAFAYTTELRSFTVHKEVTAIGANAFNGCTNLETVRFAEGCAVQSIGNYAFYESGLKSIEIPATVKTLGDGIFQDCQELTSVVLHDGLESIGKEAFKSCNAMRILNIPQTVESVGKDALVYCVSLEELRLDAPVSLGTLEWCHALTHVTLGEKVTTVPDYMFQNCGSLKTITAEADLTYVGECAFYGTALEDFPFSDALTGIGEYAFTGTALTEVVLPDTVTQIPQYTFSGCKALRTVDVGAGVETVGHRAFADCENLTEVNLCHVKVIASEAFHSCAALTDVHWSDRLEEIYGYSFQDCTALKQAVLPGTLKQLSHNAFYRCTGLETVYFKGDAPVIEEYGFADLTVTAYYPVGNETWDESVRQNYSGTVTWVPYEPETDNVQCGENLQWKIVGGDTLQISGTGDMYSFTDDADRPWHWVADTVKHIEIEAGVTGISPGAFAGFTALESITFVGEAPELQNGQAVFDGVTAKAYYPAVSVGWTAEKRAAFGGNVTWTAYDNVVDKGSCGENLTWAFTTDNTLTISGTGEMAVYTGGQTPWRAYRDQYTKLIINEGVTTISREAFENSDVLTEVSLPQSLKTIDIYAFSLCGALTKIVIPDQVTSLGNYAFQQCNSLENVTLPDGMKSIGSYVFASCRKLTTINIPRALEELGDRAFWDCQGLTQIDLPKGITKIEMATFFNCSGLESITFQGQIKTIQQDAFVGCSGLKEIIFSGDAPTSVHGEAFRSVTAVCYYPAGNDTWLADVMQNYGGNLTWMPLGESVEIIIASGECGEGVSWSVNDGGTLRIYGSGAMDDYFEANPPWQDYLPQVKVIVIEDSVTHVGAYAFYECEAATRAFFGKDILSIGAGAFAYSGIDGITLPESLTAIGEGAFAGCSALTGIKIPKNVTEIGQYAFYGCGSMRAISVDGANAVYSSDFGILYNKDKTVLIQCPAGYEDSVHCADTCLVIMQEAFAGCEKVTSVQGYNVQQIGQGAFIGCTALEYVSLSEEMTVIPVYAFALCENLKTIDRMEYITEIQEAAFYACTGLESIELPAGLSNIGTEAFGYCTGLKKISFTGQAPAIDDTAFTGVTAEAIYPRDKQTWTAEVLKDYGGDLTWKKEPEPVVTQIAGGNCSSTVSWKLYDNGKLVISGTGAIPDYTKNDGAPWLEYAETISELVVEQGITGLGDWNFYAPNMVSSQLPASLKSISQSAFLDCRKLTGLHVAEGNAVYASHSGVLYNKAMTELLWCPDGYSGELILANTTKTVSAYAFQYCRNITSVVIPAGVTFIDEYAFMDCVGTLIFNDGSHTGLMEVIFEGDAPTFGQYIFQNMRATIFYPANNATWTDEVRQSYGGERIVWQAYTKGILGDVSGDGILDSYDATLILQYDVGMISGNTLRLELADVSGDGIVDSYDATLILQYDVGMITKFPAA